MNDITTHETREVKTKIQIVFGANEAKFESDMSREDIQLQLTRPVSKISCVRAASNVAEEFIYFSMSKVDMIRVLVPVSSTLVIVG